jgi:hypothetical protein
MPNGSTVQPIGGVGGGHGCRGDANVEKQGESSKEREEELAEAHCVSAFGEVRSIQVSAIIVYVLNI